MTTRWRWARTHLALLHLHLHLAEPEAAAQHTRWSQRHAERADHRRGLAMCQLLAADIAARRSRHDEALAPLAQGLDRFAALGIDEALNHESAARVQRLAGQLDGARRAVQHGLGLSRDCPLLQAELWLEMALLQQQSGNSAAALQARAAARAGFLACGTSAPPGAAVGAVLPATARLSDDEST